MPNWGESMQQYFAYYEVDIATWRDIKPLDMVISSTISRDIEADSDGSASFNITEGVGEKYVRTYLVTNQNGIEERTAVGTHLIQTPELSYNGMYSSYSADAYSPLIELKEKLPPIGYYLAADTDVLSEAYSIVRAHCRAPVIKCNFSATTDSPSDDGKLKRAVVADTGETWLDYIIALLANINYTIAVDPYGYIKFKPNISIDKISPVYEYTDDDASILLPDVDISNDIYGIPNVVEIICSDDESSLPFKSIAKNEDSNSPTSIYARGREIMYRETDPELKGYPSQDAVDEYAENMLKSLSTITRTITFTHGYCGTQVGDCVTLTYKRAGLDHIKARVIQQTINCETGCTVDETLEFTTKLWG